MALTHCDQFHRFDPAHLVARPVDYPPGGEGNTTA